ncbi:MAG TPA: hypothetical protein PLW10_01790 [Myxococcota bacterium]|nr:hypothetical protein [Myxococcales bacterium]HPG24339.1 hypothetical protein [Myxococcota bacterium]
MTRAEPVDDEAWEAMAAMIADRGVPLARLADLLDALDPERRPRVVRRLGRSLQRTLYERAEGHAPLALVDLVPPSRADLEPVRHLGRNTLPAFTIFEKRFCRPPDCDPAAPSRLAGYNHQAMAPVTGPGYFVAVEDAGKREVLVDYRRLPETVPPGWPPVRSNERGIARFVYGFMVDRLRRVSEHVTIGSAARNGRDLGSYFVLARET